MTSNRAPNSFDVHALLARRVLPLALTILLWSALLGGAWLAWTAR